MNKILIEDITKIKCAGGVVISPDGKHAVFTVNEPDVKKNSYKYNLWLMDVKKGKASQFTFQGKDRSAIWDDSETLLIPTVRSEADTPDKIHKKSCFYRLSIKGGEACKAFEVNENVMQIFKVSDGLYAMTILRDRNWLDPDQVDKELCEEELDYHVIDELPLWGNGRGFVSGKRTGLFLYNETTEELKQLTDPYFDVRTVSVQDGKIAYTGACWHDIITRCAELNIYDTKTGETVQVVAPEQMKIGPMAFAGDSVIYLASDMKKWGSGQLSDIYRYDLASGKSEMVWKNDIEMSLGSNITTDTAMIGGKTYVARDGIFYITGLSHAKAEIYSFGKDDQLKKAVNMPGGGIVSFDVYGDTVVMTAQPENAATDIFTATLGEKPADELKQVTHINDELFKDKYIAKAEYIPFTDSDGVQIDGWILKPFGYDPEKKYPAVLEVHGGPRMAYGTGMMHEMQALASAGYFVFFCNPRGGESYGEAFADLRGKYGTVDFQDLMEFTDHVLKLFPQIDPARLAETGGSYGGFMSNWIVGHTDRFAAIASQRSIANWINDWGDSEIGVTFDANETGADPWTDMEKMWQQSPYKYANNAKTPILFIHSLQDYNCTINQGVEMFAAMKYFNVPSRMCLFEGENHSLSRSGKPKHRVRRLKEIFGWFEKYV
ncbi:MAG: S9 family peptidase [Firmicutes bacterium]|nr:S9 family peptidase [Bacillota bacterium]